MMFCLAVGFSPVNVGNNPSDTKEHPLSRIPIMTTIELFFTVFDRVFLIRANGKGLTPIYFIFLGSKPKRDKQLAEVVKQITWLNQIHNTLTSNRRQADCIG